MVGILDITITIIVAEEEAEEVEVAEEEGIAITITMVARHLKITLMTIIMVGATVTHFI